MKDGSAAACVRHWEHRDDEAWCYEHIVLTASTAACYARRRALPRMGGIPVPLDLMQVAAARSGMDWAAAYWWRD